MTNKTYGTVSAEQQKAMTGLEFVQGLADGTLPLGADGSVGPLGNTIRHRRPAVCD